MSVFLLTSSLREPLVRQGGTTFTFVTDGLDAAMSVARAAAGDQANSVAGGAETVQRFLQAGLLDELLMHQSTVVLGGGVRLFEGAALANVRLEPVRVEGSGTVTHLHCRPVR